MPRILSSVMMVSMRMRWRFPDNEQPASWFETPFACTSEQTLDCSAGGTTTHVALEARKVPLRRRRDVHYLKPGSRTEPARRESACPQRETSHNGAEETSVLLV